MFFTSPRFCGWTLAFILSVPITCSVFAQSPPKVSVSSNAPFCEWSMNLQLSESGGDAVSWNWKGPNGFASKAQNPVIPLPNANASGTYSVTVSGANGATASATLNVTIHVLPIADAGADVGVCAGEKAQLSGSGGVSCRWEPSAGLDNSLICKPLATVNKNGYYTLAVTDANGCTATDRVDVFVHKPSNLVCNNLLHLSLPQSGNLNLMPDQVLEGSYPFYGFYEVSIKDAAGNKLSNTLTCADIGKKLSYSVTDRCDQNTCSGELKVEDKLPPRLSCTDLTVPCALPELSPAYLKNFLGIAAAFPKVEENCAQYNLTFSEEWNSLACEDKYNGISGLSGYYTRTWLAVDAYQNFETCVQRVFVRRLKTAELMLPKDTVLSCVAPFAGPSATGAPYFSFLGKNFPLYPNTYYCELGLSYTEEEIAVCPSSKKVVRKWIIMDWCQPVTPTPPFSNPLYYTQIIKVLDDNKPLIACPPNTTVGTEPFTCCAIVDLPDALAEDACSGIQKARADIQLRDPFTGDVIGELAYAGVLSHFPKNNLWHPDTMAVFGKTACIVPGAHTVTYTVEDGCGNKGSCVFQLSVEDQTPPVTACDKTTQVAIGADGDEDVFASTFDDGSFDICCAINLEARRMNGRCDGTPDDFGPTVAFCCEDIGKILMVVLKVSDCNGNENECMVEVEVIDKIRPSCVPPADRTISCEAFDPSLWAHGMASGEDNCCFDTLIQTPNYALFDTFCNRGTIVRHFKTIDCYGNFSTCSQRIVVFYESDYYLRMPNDVVTKVCNGTSNFGVPTFFNTDCEKIGYSFDDEVFTVVPGACFKIERTWKIINWCAYDPLKPCTFVPNPEPSPNPLDPTNIRGPVIGPPGTNGSVTTTIVKITPQDSVPTNFTNFWNPNTNCYIYKQVIKVVDSQDPKIANCPKSDVPICDLTDNDPQLWNDPLWLEPLTQGHNLCEGPTDLSITATDLCSKALISFHYLLALDLDGDGTMESVVNSNAPENAGFVRFGNVNTPNLQGGELRQFDQRPVPDNQKYRFAVQTSSSGNNVTASMRWNTPATPATFSVPELPYGKHKIKWIVEDGCGNETICEYNFEVKDCKAPSVVCHNGLSTNIMQTGMATLWAADFLLYGIDNCTPANRLTYAIRKQGKGSGFPTDASGMPIQSITFDCTELGQQGVELWAKDLAGNIGYCVTYIIVQNVNKACLSDSVSISGSIVTEKGEGLEEANIEITSLETGNNPLITKYLSDNTGKYAAKGVTSLGASLSIAPFKEENPLNGVSTYDLVLISKHILGLEPFDSPLKMIAADANRSNSITTLDIVELRKMILGIYNELPNNSSWRFVPKAHVFPNPSNPFEENFPETIDIQDVAGDASEQNFYALKVGDVNHSAVANSFQQNEDRRAATIFMSMPARDVAKGEVFELTLQTPEGLSGCQFSLATQGLDILELLPKGALQAEQFALFSPQMLSFSHHSTSPASFSLRVRATQGGQLAHMLALRDNPTRAEGYPIENQGLGTARLALRFIGETGENGALALYQNQPNPFAEQSVVTFELPEASKATLTVFDESSKMLYEKIAFYPKGQHQISLKSSELGTSSGVLFYRVKTDQESITRKMLRTRN